MHDFSFALNIFNINHLLEFSLRLFLTTKKLYDNIQHSITKVRMSCHIALL